MIKPFYLTGRAHQRSFVLRWLEESYESREPVDFATLTIEHVLPQSPTPEWLEHLSAEEPEDKEQLHAELVHTLANLTLTGYNSALSNSPFPVKRALLATSGLRMNQQIAAQERWGTQQIRARGVELAKRVASIWPGPITGVSMPGGPNWSLLESALAALPVGAWTTYGDLAALIGSHAVPVGQYLATSAGTPNPHRVLKSTGVVSPDFRWLDGEFHESPRTILEKEGVVFDESGRAAEEQRFTSQELAVLVGMRPDSLLEELSTPAAGEQTELRDQFVSQLGSGQDADTVHGVLALLNGWTALGGHLEFGQAGEVSCYLMARRAAKLSDRVWPFAIYPSGKVEVVFQWMLWRPPFDGLELREAFRQRLNEIPDVDLPAAKVSMRPGFHVEVAREAVGRETLLSHLAWFKQQVDAADAAGAPPSQLNLALT